MPQKLYESIELIKDEGSESYFFRPKAWASQIEDSVITAVDKNNNIHPDLLTLAEYVFETNYDLDPEVRENTRERLEKRDLISDDEIQADIPDTLFGLMHKHLASESEYYQGPDEDSPYLSSFDPVAEPSLETHRFILENYETGQGDQIREYIEDQDLEDQIELGRSTGVDTWTEDKPYLRVIGEGLPIGYAGKDAIIENLERMKQDENTSESKENIDVEEIEQSLEGTPISVTDGQKPEAGKSLDEIAENLKTSNETQVEDSDDRMSHSTGSLRIDSWRNDSTTGLDRDLG